MTDDYKCYIHDLLQHSREVARADSHLQASAEEAEGLPLTAWEEEAAEGEEEQAF